MLTALWHPDTENLTTLVCSINTTFNLKVQNSPKVRFMHCLAFVKSSRDLFAIVCPTLFSSEMCSCREELQWDSSFFCQVLEWAQLCIELVSPGTWAPQGKERCCKASLWNTWDFNLHYEHHKALTLHQPLESKARASFLGRDDPSNVNWNVNSEHVVLHNSSYCFIFYWYSEKIEL